MAITRVQTATGNNGTTATTTVAATWPATTTPGNLLAACIAYTGNVSTFTTPAGWTPGPALGDGANNSGLAMFFLDPAAHTIGRTSETITASSRLMCIKILEYSNTPALAFNVSASNSSAVAATPIDSGTTAATLDGQLLGLAAMAHKSATSDHGAPSDGYTLTDSATVLSGNATPANNCRMSVAEKIYADSDALAQHTSVALTVANRTWVGAIMTFGGAIVGGGTYTRNRHIGTARGTRLIRGS